MRDRRTNAVSSSVAQRAMTFQCLVAFVIAVAASTAAFAQPVPVGRVKLVSGAAFIVREQRTIPARVGADLFEADTLTTGTDGRIGVTLRDDTRVSLGQGSEVRLDRFLYAPADGQFAFVLKVFRGVAAYVSG